MARNNNPRHNPFKNAVSECDEIRNVFKSGLSALGRNSASVIVEDTNQLNGSVDIDSAVKEIRPNDARWDYTFGYKGNAYFLEVHPADTKNVDEMIKKVKWLKDWLTSVAPDLKHLHKCGVFHWIPSGRVNILPSSSQHRKIALNNLCITKVLKL